MNGHTDECSAAMYRGPRVCICHRSRSVGPSRTIRVDQDVYDHIWNNRRVGESIQAATTRLVNQAIAKEEA